MKAWILAARMKTLGASWVPVLATSAWVYRTQSTVSLWVFLCALGSSLAIQIATNLFNDAIDFEKGADPVHRLGPKRVTATGMIPVKKVYRAGFLCVGIATLLGVPLVVHGGWPILVLGITSLALAYGYTGGPFPLAYLGLGDLFVFLFFGIAAAFGTYFLETKSSVIPASVWILASQIGLWATVLIAINNFRDFESDRSNHKMTLPARFGPTFSRVEITALLIVPYLLGAYFWGTHENIKAAFLPLLTLPIAFKIIYSVWSEEPSERFNRLLAMSGAVHMLSGLLLVASFLWK
jgi:1,4-dihydroxy-2-naphthoate octaprenyltransferase